MKLQTEPRLPSGGDRSLIKRLQEIFRDSAKVANQLAEGRIAARYNAVDTVPVIGDYAVGDFVANSAPVESGAPGSKYVLDGWKCTAAPLTFVECRYLTGN